MIKRFFYVGQGFGPAAFLCFVSNDGQFSSLVPPEGQNMTGWAFPMEGARWTLSPDVKPGPPGFLLGTKIMPASPTDWEHAFREPSQGPGRWYTVLPRERAFHLIGFVNGMGPKDQYMVLGG